MKHVLTALLLGLAAILFLAACGPRAADAPAADQQESKEMDEQPGDASATTAADPLAGTAWQLVSISSMDDSIDVPRNPAEYTLRFDTDGRVAVRADCNRGGGTWMSDGASLSFGPLAMTRAMCPPGSLHDKFVAQLTYVRSYVLENGNLHLATMADGSIIEFEPLVE